MKEFHKTTFVLLLVAIVGFLLFNFYYLPLARANKIKKENEEKIKLNNLISCIEREHLNTLQEFYKLCGVNNEKDCPFLNALNASFESKYQQKKGECLKSFYYER